ncbi:hypothetical protein CHS0354_040002 [Potamilus streckersoni]|uniref:Uncharacterized protein n=1 Tax=Potamilus streckersoni TaxID=2493646 RepID=A0AAE0S039_9BIVA|nr:hypothetical protein CHS0354_040002 [Potamilus streckersoni]
MDITYVNMVLYISAVSVAITTIYFIIKKRNLKLLHDVTSRYVLITGCDSGFGYLLAKLLDSKGIPVVAACLTQKGGENLRNESSSRLTVISLDVTDSQSIKQALDKVNNFLGPDKGLWGLVNNAGIMTSFSPSETVTAEGFRNICDVNMLGPIEVTLTFLPLIRKSKGRIVNVCSVAATTALPFSTNYCVSKAGLRMFTQCLRRELYGSGVLVQSINPGGFATNLTNIQRLRALCIQAYNDGSEDVRCFYGGNIAREGHNILNFLQYQIPVTKDKHKM